VRREGTPVPVQLSALIRRHPTFFVIYVVFAVHSLLFQASIRLTQCEGFGSCTVSLAKDVVWSLVWPLYWLAYLNYFGLGDIL
jgi:hypothetical protein